MDRLPLAVVPLAFPEPGTLPDCLRSALTVAKRLGCGALFEWGEQVYTVQPWMSVDQALELGDTALAASVREHLHG